jgi:LPPG:FO 2-phospho-L-lactate transferase
VAITPIVAGAALKGPTVEMMRAVGPEPNPVEVARMYRDVAAGFVLDDRDHALAHAVEKMGLRTLVVDTVMSDGGAALAARILEAFTSRASWRP